MFKLLRYFVVTSFAAFAVVTVMLGRFYTQRATDDLLYLEEIKNVTLTRAVANAIHDDLRSFLILSAGLSGDELRARPETVDLGEMIHLLMEGQAIVKVKVYDLNGLTIFSTEMAQIGENKRDNDGFQAARQGEIVSELTHRDTFSGFEATLQDRDVLASYMPLFTDRFSGEVEGVVEVYSDVTPLLQRIISTQRAILFGVTTLLGLLYLFLFLIVFRADKIVHHQTDELNQAREAAEKANRSKSEFVSFVTHELNTPITVIKTYVELFNRGSTNTINARQARYLDVICLNINRMTALTSDLLDNSRMETGVFQLDFEAVSISDVVCEATQSVKKLVEEKGQSLTLDLTEELPQVRADRRRLLQVLTNLVSNAYKYTPSGGEIKVSAHALSANGHGPKVEVLVTDNGIGIDEKDQGRIFQRFFRSDDTEVRQVNGTGLGLHMARNLAELHGGKIWFESEYRRGTTFHLTVPAISDHMN